MNSAAFAVKRNLLTGAIVEATCDEVEVPGKKYDGLLAEKIGIKDDFQSLTRLQSHLFFFGENRCLLAWENRLQHELINLMLADHSTYQRLDELWRKVKSADSTARNLSAQAARMEKDLKSVSQSVSKVAVLQTRCETSQLTALRVELEKRVSAIQKRITEEERLEVLQSEKITRIHSEFHNALEELEATQSSDLDEQLLAAALANPTIASVRNALEEFYRAPNDRGCPCCGRAGIAATISRLAETAAANARAGSCVVCSKALPRSHPAGRPVERPVDRGISAKAAALQTVLFQREQTRSRIIESRAEVASVLQQLAEAGKIELQHVQKNPSGSGDHMRIAIEQMRGSEKRAKNERDRELVALNKALTTTNAVFKKIQSKIATAFKKYASLYLDEPCDVKVLKESELPGKRGAPQVKAPHAAFFPVVSGHTRPSAQALSDAQRSFVDLAFRMAVIDVWHQITKGTVTMIVETPEGAVDIAYMERVATMIRTFGDQGHTLIITTNLNNDIFLPEVMARWLKPDRAAHVLNLLEQGNPRPVQTAHKPHFDAILRKVDSHSRAK
ncbi:MAG: hypothetical protein SGI71_11460 [Verrucomicrobiota bacterium]|nr:hypothetical protein [Verrucomicrobiota bacterium]